MRRNSVTYFAFIEKIYKQGVTHIYWRKYDQSFKVLKYFWTAYAFIVISHLNVGFGKINYVG